MFEINNKLCSNTYSINATNEVITYQLGNLEYYKL